MPSDRLTKKNNIEKSNKQTIGQIAKRDIAPLSNASEIIERKKLVIENNKNKLEEVRNSLGLPSLDEVPISIKTEQELISNLNQQKSQIAENKESPKDIFVIAQEEAKQIIIKPEDRNSEGKLLVFPGGPKSNLSSDYWKLVRTPAFKKWFRNSDVKDENGEPALVYHTTNHDLKNFDNFSKEEARSNRKVRIEEYTREKESSSGFYLSSRESFSYGKNRLSVFMNAKLKITDSYFAIQDLNREQIHKYQEKGYSGLAYLIKNFENSAKRDKINYRRNFAPKSASDFIFYGYNNLFNKKNLRDRKNILESFKERTRITNELNKESSSPFYEVVAFDSNQLMIVNKEEGK